MAEKQETHADIIAEMRMFKCRNLETGELELCNAIGNYFADRLEAAIKRERESTDAKIADLQSRVKLWTDRSAELVNKCNEYYANARSRERGDCAKMREALESIASNLEHRLFARYPSSASDEWMYQKANTALAAPPRNCDRFATVDEARKAHEAICEKYGKCHHGCPLNNEEHYSAFDCFEAWLFAPATEKEGGDDGNE